MVPLAALSHDYHIVLLGDLGVGKTEWLVRIFGREPSPVRWTLLLQKGNGTNRLQYLPTMLDIETISFTLEGELYTVTISDTGSEEVPEYLFEDADGFIVMYNPGKRYSYGHALNQAARIKDKPACLVANRHETEEVPKQEGFFETRKLRWEFVETSRSDPQPRIALERTVRAARRVRRGLSNQHVANDMIYV